MEACRIAIQLVGPRQVNVGAPMKHKPLCYDILRDAKKVIDATPDSAFRDNVGVITIVMDMTGRVDVGAPLPNRELCAIMLTDAKSVIERYDDEQAPVMKPFDRVLMGHG